MASSKLFEVKPCLYDGLGVFATQQIPRGTRILTEAPLMAVPLAYYMEADVNLAFAKLTQEQKDIYMGLASAHGQDPNNWPHSVLPGLPRKEVKKIQEQHAARTGKEKTIMSVFLTNCMEMARGAAVFPQAARFNHSCVPNAFFTWNELIQKETIHAMKDIAEGEEITLSYVDPYLDEGARRWELKHYGFKCDCPACGVPEEGSFASESLERRFRLREIDEQNPLGHMTFPLSQGLVTPFLDQRLKHALEAAGLLRAEGLESVELGMMYWDVAAICEVKKDYNFAMAAAREGHLVLLRCLGEDSKSALKSKDKLAYLQGKIAEVQGHSG